MPSVQPDFHVERGDGAHHLEHAIEILAGPNLRHAAPMQSVSRLRFSRRQAASRTAAGLISSSRATPVL